MAHARSAKWREPANHTAKLQRLDSEALLRAAAANHRSWFRRNALTIGGHVERAELARLLAAGRPTPS
jgi:hypothetical protein